MRGLRDCFCVNRQCGSALGASLTLGHSLSELGLSVGKVQREETESQKLLRKERLRPWLLCREGGPQVCGGKGSSVYASGCPPTPVVVVTPPRSSCSSSFL